MCTPNSTVQETKEVFVQELRFNKINVFTPSLRTLAVEICIFFHC